MSMLTKRPERYTETAIDDEIVLMRLDNGEFYSLSETAAAAWRLIDGSRDRQALLEALTHEFAGDEDGIAADLDEFLLELEGAGLIDRR